MELVAHKNKILRGVYMNIYYKIKNALFCNVDCLRARWQRFLRGYSYGDVWDMDFWFKRTVKSMLIHLKNYGISVPNDLYIADAENERAAWEAVLDEMIECLDFMDEDNVKELALKALERGEKIEGFLPFMDEDDVKELMLMVMKSNK
jgi:hypothetical protein